MPKLPNKCICQLCTCGRHMCPHRKKSPPLPANGKKEATRSDLAVAASDGKRQRKQWNLANGQNEDAIPPEKIAGREALSDATNLTAISIRDKGRSNTYIADGSDPTSKEIKSESWNKRQIPKTQMIRKPDTLSFSGPVSLETTHKATYTKKALEGGDFGDEKSEKISPKEKLHRSRPRTSLKMSGDFQTVSSYNQEYTPKRLEDDLKIRKDTQLDHLKPEGDMLFNTTSLDYNASVHSSRMAEGSQEEFTHAKIQRPQSEIKIPPVALSDETTATTDYKKWEVEKPVRYKPADSFKFSDTESMEAYGSRAEDKTSRNEALKSDLKRWGDRYERTMIMKPENNLRPEGDFNFDTTHDVAYSSSKAQRSRNSRMTSNLETLDESNDAGGGEAILMKDKSERNVMEQESRAVQNGTSTSADQEPSQEPSHIQSENNYEANASTDAIMNNQELTTQASQTMTDTNMHEGAQSAHYLTWDQIRPKPIRPHSNLRQEGAMEFSTTNRREFVERPLERVKGIRPKTTTKLPEGEFEGTTMNQLMFTDDRITRVNPIRPKSNLHVAEGEFTNETTSSREYQTWDFKRPLPIIHKSSLTQEGSMDFTTTNHTEFEEKHPEKIYPIRPKTTNKVMEGDFDETTTSKTMHHEFPIERVTKIVPQSNLRMSSGAFESETTNRTQFQNWGFDRPNPIRPVSNLRQEGEMDFTTMNQTQFDEKTMERVYQFRPHTSSKTTGEFDGTTTNQLMYSGQQPLQVDRARKIVPKGTIQTGVGQFSKNTTNNSEYQLWNQAQPQQPVTPKNNLHQEGDFDFVTTNQIQFNTKEIDRVSEIRPKSTSKMTGDFEGTTTNREMYQYVTGEKAQGVRPHTNIQLEKGNFASETTTDKEFQNWGYSKPNPIKPRSSIRNEGDMEFTTMNNMQFEGKTTERVGEIRPITSTKILGDFDGTTTNQLTFRNHQVGEKVKGKRPSTNLHVERGRFEDQTTARREFQQWELSKPDPIRHAENLTQEGDMDFTTSNQTQFDTKPITRVHQIRPHVRSAEKGEFNGITTNQAMYQVPLMEKVHDIRPKDNIHVEIGNFEDQTTTMREFAYKSSDKPEAIMPRPNLSQEGDFDFTTSNQLQFEQKPISKSQQMRPKTKTKMSEGKFYSTTTNQAMYQTPVIDQVHEIRPITNLHVENGKFQDTTTSSDEYKRWDVERPKAYQLVSSLKQEGDMQFETTNNSEFQERNLERVHQIRPKTTTKIEGDFEGTTTNQTMYQQHNKLERVKPIRQQNNLYVESGEFLNETTSRREFKQWVKMENQNSTPKGKLRAAGICTQKDRRKGRKGVAKEIKEENNDGQKTDISRTRKRFEKENGGEKLHDSEQLENEIKPEASDLNSTETNLGVEGKDSEHAEAETRHGLDAEESGHEHGDLMMSQETADANGEATTSHLTDIAQSETAEQQNGVQANVDGEGGEKSFEKDAISELKTGSQRERAKLAAAGKFSSEIDRAAHAQTFLRNTPPTKPSKRFKPDDNIKIEHVPFNGASTTRTEFQKWEGKRSSSKRRSQTLKQEGKMEFKTTSEDYSVTTEHQNAQERLKAKSKAALHGTLTQTGGMEFTTTSKTSYAGTTVSRTKNLRPRSSLKIGVSSNTNGDMATSQSSRSNPETNTYQSDQSTARADYVGHVATRTRVHRPTTSQKVGQGRFEGKSTTRSSFVVPTDQVTKTKSFKPENHKILNGENGFLGDTTYKSSFESKQRHCPVIDLEQGRSQLYFNEEVDGHRFYLPRVQG